MLYDLASRLSNVMYVDTLSFVYSYRHNYYIFILSKKIQKKKVYSCQNQYRWAFGYLRATPTLTKGVKSQQIVRSGQIYIYIYANFLSIHQGIIPVVVILNM